MVKLTGNAPGIYNHPMALTDRNGIGTIPVQLSIPAGTTVSARIVGRLSPDAPWVEIRQPSAASFLESCSWLPYLGLEILSISGGGTITLWLWDN